MKSVAINLDRLRRHPFLTRVDWHAVLPSTNDRALELAALESLETPLLILSDEQTAGRGRAANRWWSQRGALTFSLVLEPGADRGVLDSPSSAETMRLPLLRTDHWPRVALTAGLALCESLAQLVPHLDFGLKWPNDVLLAGKKLAGILVEIPPVRPPVPRRLVLGMGVNVNNSLADAPAEIQATGTSLCDAGGLEFDSTELLLGWLTQFASNLQALAADQTDLATRWQARCVLTGKQIALQTGERELTGLCRGIEADGALLLDTPAGRERLYAGTLVRIVGA